MLLKKDKVVYPYQGAGWIKDVTSLILNGEKVDYYEVAFVDSDVTVSIPVSKAEELGLRELPSQAEVEEALVHLGKRVKLNSEKLEVLKTMSTKDINTTDMKVIIDVINTIVSYDKTREQSLGVVLHRVLQYSKQFIRSISIAALGESVLTKYPLLERVDE